MDNSARSHLGKLTHAEIEWPFQRVCPVLPLVDELDSRAGNPESLREHSRPDLALELANLSRLLGRELGPRIIFALQRTTTVKAILSRVFGVPLISHPFEVLGAVVVLVRVLMVHDQPRWAWPMKGRCDKDMHAELPPLIVAVEGDGEVFSLRRLPQKSPGRCPAAGKHATDPAETRCVVPALVAGDGPPLL